MIQLESEKSCHKFLFKFCPARHGCRKAFPTCTIVLFSRKVAADPRPAHLEIAVMAPLISPVTGCLCLGSYSFIQPACTSFNMTTALVPRVVLAYSPLTSLAISFFSLAVLLGFHLLCSESITHKNSTSVKYWAKHVSLVFPSLVQPVPS